MREGRRGSPSLEGSLRIQSTHGCQSRSNLHTIVHCRSGALEEIHRWYVWHVVDDKILTFRTTFFCCSMVKEHLSIQSARLGLTLPSLLLRVRIQCLKTKTA